MSEFAGAAEIVAELGLGLESVLPAVRRTVDLGAGGQVSAIVHGRGQPEFVFLHGGGQNAHTWDLVVTALGKPAVAIDLPGHGHSTWREDRDYSPGRNAGPVAAAIERLGPGSRLVVGMSLGGLTALRVARLRPELVRALVLVDVTPGSASRNTTMRDDTSVLTAMPRTFNDLQAVVARAIAASPRRPAAAVRRGTGHNVRRLPDGAWTWRYDAMDVTAARTADQSDALWDDLGALRIPLLVVRGAVSRYVVEEDVAQLKRRHSDVQVVMVQDSGHAVQSDQPAVLAELLSAVSADSKW